MKEKFVPDSFIVPEKLETDDFRLRMLTPQDVEIDYEAVMSSREHLLSIIPEESNTWPEENMTIEDDLEDLERHQDEFLKREAFAYTVVSLDEKVCLGCVYIDPSKTQAYDAEVYLWARQSELERGLELQLHQALEEWLNTEWPFKRVAFPGRSIDWADWRALLKGEQNE